MFREMLRFKQQLSREECVEVLKTTLRGVLSLNGDDGYPYGVPINHYALSDLRSLFGIVNQDVFLFDDTVYNNLIFGTENATEEEVVTAAKIAQAHDFIMELEEGYQTPIGNRGMRLSGGQRQRLMIARAIIAKTTPQHRPRHLEKTADLHPRRSHFRFRQRIRTPFPRSITSLY